MKLSCYGLLLCLLGLLAGCAETTDLSRLGDSSVHEERRLLVTFVDRTIGRNLQGNALEEYRTGGMYQNSDWSERKARELAERHRLQLIAQWPVTELGVSCVLYQVPEILALDQVMQALRQDQAIASVQPLHSFYVLSVHTPDPQPDNDPYLRLQTGFQSLGVASLHHITTGRGVRIALIDTGVDLSHPDLQGQMKHLENMAPEPADHNLADVHGTAVAGVLAARPNNGIGIAGIAPEAEILAFRACWPVKPGALAARCNSFTLALALNQALRMNSRIINLSLGGPEDPLLRQLLEKALAKGVIVIAAIPNKGQADGFPVSTPGVITVGADGSNHPGIIAPGKDILTTVPHQGYDFMTGNSFAAPHVAGVAALLLQLNPDWGADKLMHLLRNDDNTLTTHIFETALAVAKHEDAE